MTRYGKLAIVVALAALGSYVAFAQQKGGGMMQGNGMMGQGKMMQMCDMHTMMAQCMTQENLVATSDGGVVVLVGNQLMKYDDDLELVQQTEVQVDYQAMQSKMQKMMENCPMMKTMKDDSAIMGGSSPSNK